jgi:hypothetical protein
MRISAVAVAVGRAARGRDVATPRVMGRDDLVLELHLFFVRTWCTVRYAVFHLPLSPLCPFFEVDGVDGGGSNDVEQGPGR